MLTLFASHLGAGPYIDRRASPWTSSQDTNLNQGICALPWRIVLRHRDVGGGAASCCSCFAPKSSRLADCRSCRCRYFLGAMLMLFAESTAVAIRRVCSKEVGAVALLYRALVALAVAWKLVLLLATERVAVACRAPASCAPAARALFINSCCPI